MEREEESALPLFVQGGLTRLFNALDRDQDGHLMASDLNLLARVITGRSVTEFDARSELQRVKAIAEKRIGAKKTFQKDVLCLDEFLACSWFLESISEDKFQFVINEYIAAVGRITGTIPQYELIMLKSVREQYHQAQASNRLNQLTGELGRVKQSRVDLMRMRSMKNMFTQ